MSQFNLKGEVESMRPIHLDFIKDVLEKRGYEKADVSIKPLGQAGDNYMSNVKRIEVTENGKTLKMVAKLAPDNQIMRELGNLDDVFINEHYVYKELLPKFRELQEKAGVPEEDTYRFAEYYGSNVDAPNEVILLEDLNQHDYEMLDRFKPLSDDCVRLVLKNFAIYHSLSYVLKHQDPDTFSAIAAKLRNMYEGMLQKKEVHLLLQNVEEGCVAIMREEKYKRLLMGTTSNFSIHLNNVKSDIGSKYSVIQQGDGWTNNILFKFEGNKPVSCALIDYQLARENNPCFDILYMLCTSTAHDQLLKRFPEYLDYYHEELNKSLNYFGLTASTVYPREQFNADLKRYGKFMVATAVFALTFTLKKPEQAAQYQEVMKNGSLENSDDAISAMVASDSETDDLLREKIKGMLDTFLEFGLIEED